MTVSRQLCVFVILFTSAQLNANTNPILGVSHFLSSYLEHNSSALSALRSFAEEERNKRQNQDQWKSRLEATPQLSFENQKFDSSSRQDNTNRTSNVLGRFTQSMPTGTQLELNAQKYLEVQNPLFSSLDRSYSAKITQDLFKNAFGKSQRAQSDQAEKNYEAAQLRMRQSIFDSCEEGFKLYTEAFVQQEVLALYQEQLEDAKQALKASHELYRSRLINKIDHLSSESDFINLQLQVQQAQQQLDNSTRRMQAFLYNETIHQPQLTDPMPYLENIKVPTDSKTTLEKINEKKLSAQLAAVERARSDRSTDVQLGIEAGERFGRLSFSGPLINYNEEYLRATLTVGLDFINETEDANLKTAIEIRNNLEKERSILNKVQNSLVYNLKSNNELLAQQIETSQKQSELLKEKVEIAFKKMKKAGMDFENYLLHRNSYLNQKRNHLNLKKDYLLGLFSLQKHYAHSNTKMCQVKL